MVYVLQRRTGSDYRVGDVGLIGVEHSRSAPPGQYSYGPTNMSWIQLNTEAMPSSLDDPHGPILIGWPVESGPFTEAATVELVRTAVADAKPRRVERISHAGSFDVIVALDDPASVLPRRVTYRREGTQWIAIRRD